MKVLLKPITIDKVDDGYAPECGSNSCNENCECVHGCYCIV